MSRLAAILRLEAILKTDIFTISLVVILCMLPLACADGGQEQLAPDGDLDHDHSDIADSDTETETSDFPDTDLHLDADEADLELPLPAVDDLPDSEELPDPLLMLSGDRVETAEDWEKRRRPETLLLLQHYAYGYTPLESGSPEAETWVSVPDFLDGRARMEVLRITAGPGEGIVIQLLLVIPNDLASPPPVFLGLNFFGNHTIHADPRIPMSENWIPSRGEGVVDNRATEDARGTSASRWPLELLVEEGFALATLYHGDLDPDLDDFSNGVHPLYHENADALRGEHEWGAIGAWAWGLSRALDILVSHPDLDPERLIVMGHSRNGKAALWAGAQDRRIKLVISNMSGCMGAAISRRLHGETLFWMNNIYPHWFSPILQGFNDREEKLPFDQHHLIALMAPRSILIASAEDDNWADPMGEFMGAKEAEPVYRLLGESGLEAETIPPVDTLIDSRIGYHIRPGDHGISQDDWRVFIQYARKWMP